MCARRAFALGFFLVASRIFFIFLRQAPQNQVRFPSAGDLRFVETGYEIFQRGA